MALILIAAPESLVGQKTLQPAQLNALSSLTGVGSSQLIEDTNVKLGFKAEGRKVVESNDTFVFKEPIVSFKRH